MIVYVRKGKGLIVNICLSSLLFLILTNPFVVWAFEFPPLPSAPVSTVTPEFKEGEVIVKFKDDVSGDEKNKIHGKYGSEKIKELRAWHLVKTRPNLTVEDAIDLYKAESSVEYAEPNYVAHFSITPNDPRIGASWNLRKAQLLSSSNSSLAWEYYAPPSNSDIVVATIDSGVDYLHEDLSSNIWINPFEIQGLDNIYVMSGGHLYLDNTDNDHNGYTDDILGIDASFNVSPWTQLADNRQNNPIDTSGHGTHVAGIIGAVGNNGLGVIGVAGPNWKPSWNLKIMPCRHLLDQMDIVECIQYIENGKNAGINIVAANMSFNWYPGEPLPQSLYQNMRDANDILFITSAGNHDVDIDSASSRSYPASFMTYNYNGTEYSPLSLSNVIAVAATNDQDQRGTGWSQLVGSGEGCGYATKENGSNYGRRSVHLGAPGVNILSTISYHDLDLTEIGTNGYSGGYHDCVTGIRENKYIRLTGTSMAAPHITGLAALLKSQDPSRNWVQIKNLILTGGDDITGLKPVTITGKRMNAYNSLNCSNRKAFSVLRVSPQYNAASLYPLAAGQDTQLSVMSLNCANSAGPVTVKAYNGTTLITTLNLGEEFTTINNASIGTGVFSGTWTPSSIPTKLEFSSPGGSETFYPGVVSITPAGSSGSQKVGAAQNFAVVYNDANGGNSITWAYFGISMNINDSRIPVAIFGYNKDTNGLYISDDTGTVFQQAFCTAGSPTILSNKWATLNCSSVTISKSGNNLTVNWNITPQDTFGGKKYLYAAANDSVLTSALFTYNPAWNIEFYDIPQSYWSYTNIMNVTGNGSMSDCGGGYFCPANFVTRAFAGEYIIKAKYGANTNFSYTVTPWFNDVPSTYPQFKYIQKMKDDGITAGCGSGNYCPDSNMQRAQMAVFIIKAMGQTASTKPYNYYFDDIANDGFAGWINRTYELGITSGCGTRVYCPYSNVSKDQMAVFMSKAFPY